MLQRLIARPSVLRIKARRAWHTVFIELPLRKFSEHHNVAPSISGSQQETVLAYAHCLTAPTACPNVVGMCVSMHTAVHPILSFFSFTILCVRFHSQSLGRRARRI